jgi:hypothetical protein
MESSEHIKNLEKAIADAKVLNTQMQDHIRRMDEILSKVKGEAASIHGAEPEDKHREGS